MVRPNKREMAGTYQEWCFFSTFKAEWPWKKTDGYRTGKRVLYAKYRNIWRKYNSSLTYLYDPDYKQKPLFHVHNYFEMVYVYRGSCVHVTHDETIHLHQGDVLLMNPHILHWLYLEHPTDIVFNILLSKDFLEQTFFLGWQTTV